MNWSYSYSFLGTMRQRFAHTATEANGNLYIIGGEKTTTIRFSEIYKLNLESKELALVVVNGTMQPLSRHQACRFGKLIYIIGGFDGKSQFNKVSIFDTETQSWHSPEVLGPQPEPRSNHACVIVKNKLYLFGGNNRNVTAFDDFYSMDLAIEPLEWVRLNDKVSGSPPAGRCGHRMVNIGNKLLVYGGGTGSGTWQNMYNDLHIFDIDRNEWVQPKTEGSIPICTFPSLLTIGYKVLVFGGQNMKTHKPTNDIYLLDTVAMRWKKIELEDKPEARDATTMSIIESKAYLFGGFNRTPRNDWATLHLNWDIADIKE